MSAGTAPSSTESRTYTADLTRPRDAAYRVIQRIDGVGPVLAAVFCAELGDVARFTGAPAVGSRAGLAPKHRESDLKVHRLSITKQGSRLVRWAAIEAVQRARRPARCG